MLAEAERGTRPPPRAEHPLKRPGSSRAGGLLLTLLAVELCLVLEARHLWPVSTLPYRVGSVALALALAAAAIGAMRHPAAWRRALAWVDRPSGRVALVAAAASLFWLEASPQLRLFPRALWPLPLLLAWELRAPALGRALGRGLARLRRIPLHRRALATTATLALALIASAGIGLAAHELIFPFWHYALQSALMLLLAISAVATAFLRRRRGLRRGSGVAFPAALALTVLALADPYCLLFRYDTLGPGLRLCFTHWNWERAYVRRNAEGFWEDELDAYRAADPAERTVIAAVGDSFTWGQGVLGREYRYTDRLEARLRAEGAERLDVLNFARGSGATRSETEWIRGPVRSVSPDLVLVFYLSNDIDALELLQPPRPQIGALTTALLRVSPTANVLYWKTVGPATFSGAGRAYFTNLLAAYVNEERFAAHLADVRAMVASIHEVGAQAGLVILPFPHMWEHVNPAWQERVYGAIRAEAEQAGAAVLDLRHLEQEMTLAEFQVNNLDGHPNEHAHERIADEVHAWLRDRFGGLLSAR